MSTLLSSDTGLQHQIGKFLVATGVISPQQLDVSLRQQKSVREGGGQALLAEIIVRNKFASQAHIWSAAAYFGKKSTISFCEFHLLKTSSRMAPSPIAARLRSR